MFKYNNLLGGDYPGVTFPSVIDMFNFSPMPSFNLIEPFDFVVVTQWLTFALTQKEITATQIGALQFLQLVGNYDSGKSLAQSRGLNNILHSQNRTQRASPVFSGSCNTEKEKYLKWLTLKKSFFSII